MVSNLANPADLADLADITNIFSLLPSKKGLERDLKLSVGIELGVNFCGDFVDGHEVYKLLTQEGVMLTYHLVDQTLVYSYTGKLH